MVTKHTGRRGRKRLRQGVLRFPNARGHFHGGRREGAGRPRVRGAGRRVSHSVREVFPGRYPVHVTMRLRAGLPSMRRREVDAVLRRVFCAMKARAGFKIVHYSIQSNHLHLIVEARGREGLSRAMQGLSIRVAKALNRLWGRSGAVFSDRYHAQVLRSARQVRNAIVYVLTNAWKHGVRIRAVLDRFASGWCFDGFREDVVVRGAERRERPVREPGTYLLARAWKRLGKISVYERAARAGPG